MAKKVVKNRSAKGLRIAIVVSRFNEFITQKLLDGCLEQLSQLGVLKKDIKVTWVPGAFEIPVIAQKWAKKKTIDAVICLGAIIEGQTDHYRLVADSTANGIMQVSLDSQKPVIFEVLATETIKLAEQRSDKGRDAASVAVEMAQTISNI